MRTKLGGLKKYVWSGIGAALAATASVPASAVEPPLPTTKRFLSKSLNICDMGSFYIGGVPKVTRFATSNSPAATRYEQITIGQMYVQFMVPHDAKSWPLIVLHGGMYTGASLESTDDGREGWMPYATRKGIPMYGVDYPGRGRSGFDFTRINEAVATGAAVPLITRAISDDAAMGGWIQEPYAWGFFGHLLPTGSSILDGTLIPHGGPGDPDPAAIHGTYAPDMPFDVIDPAIEARIGAIGPAPNPANNKLLALQHYKQMLPITEALNSPEANTEHALAQLVEKLGGAIISGHSGGAAITLRTVALMKQRGTLHLLKGIIQLEGTCALPAALTPQDFDRVPFMAIKGDYFDASLPVVTAPRTCPPTVAALNASRTRTARPAAFIELDAPSFRGKFKGVTHMMMLGRKSDEVFDVIADWVAKNIPKPKKNAHACARKDEKDKKGKDHRDKRDRDDHHHDRGRH